MLSEIFAGVSATGEFLDAHNGVITALATIAIAAFTVVLAVVTNRQARLTKEALVTTERAFVFLEDFDSDWAYQPQAVNKITRLLVSLRWRNSGATPTKNMTVAVNWTHWMGDLPMGFQHEYGDARLRMFLGPQATEWSTPIEIPSHVASAALKGDGHIFIWGRVDYEDIFNGTRPHFTEWCYRMKLNDRDNKLHPPQFIAYGDHNRSDEDRPRR